VSFELIILGSSSALPTSKRSTAAHLLNINERLFLIDCGEGTQIQLRKNKLSPAKINHIFISHLHGDHVFGLFGLLSSLALMGRKSSLNLYGPKALSEMMESHFSYFRKPPYEIRFHIAEDRKNVYEDSKLEVLALRLNHRAETYGYLFKEKARPLNLVKSKIEFYELGIEDIKKVKEGSDHITEKGKLIPNEKLTLPPFIRRSYAYISDTSFLPGIAKDLKGVNLLYHEATFIEEDKDLAKQTLHSTSKQAAEIAKLSAADKLLIGHFSTRYKDETVLLDEAQLVFKNTEAVNDGDRFEVEEKRTLGK
jgi:ribonuclease Z